MYISWNADKVDKDAENQGKSMEIIDAATSPVDKMNPDHSLPIHCPFFVKGFHFLQSWFGRRKLFNKMTLKVLC